jgi:hypothetical protein
MAHHIAAWLGTPIGIVIAAMVILRKREWSCAPAASRPARAAGRRRGSGPTMRKLTVTQLTVVVTAGPR